MYASGLCYVTINVDTFGFVEKNNFAVISGVLPSPWTNTQQHGIITRDDVSSAHTRIEQTQILRESNSRPILSGHKELPIGLQSQVTLLLGE